MQIDKISPNWNQTCSEAGENFIGDAIFVSNKLFC